MTKVKVSYTLDKEIIDKVEKKRGFVSASLFVNNCLKEYLLRKKVNNLIIKPLKKGS